MGEASKHVKHCDALADTEEAEHVLSDAFDETSHGLVAHQKNFSVCVADFLIQLDESHGLAFDNVLSAIDVDEDGR